ncbi:MAG: cyclic nucleotide-binding domain-containing protein [Deltaproteobacteria bacterium]|nr:cyclic nucleotide-binding domain-containing protein [Deltaproteobacteria bacterium]
MEKPIHRTALDATQNLRQFSLFSDFSPEELSDIAFLARPIQVVAGTTLFQQGDPPDGLYLVESGLVRISARLPGDEQVELARLGPGELIGEVSLVDHSLRTATAEVLESLQGYFFSRIHFGVLEHDLRSSAFRAKKKISLILCARIRGMIQEIRESLPHKKKIEDSLIQIPRRKPRYPKPKRDFRELVPELLRQLPLFADFSDADFQRFLKPLKCLNLARGTRLFLEGDPAKNCYLVIRGALSLSVSNEDTSEQLMVLGPGQIAGEIALMDGLPQPATCEVRESSIVLEMSRKQFDTLAAIGHSDAFKFFSAVNRSLVGKLRKNVRNTARLASQGRVSLGNRGGYRVRGKKKPSGLFPPDPVH